MRDSGLKSGPPLEARSQDTVMRVKEAGQEKRAFGCNWGLSIYHKILTVSGTLPIPFHRPSAAPWPEEEFPAHADDLEDGFGFRSQIREAAFDLFEAAHRVTVHADQEVAVT